MSYVVNLNKDEIDKINIEFKRIETRKAAMSVYVFIKNIQNKTTGYLDYSLNYVFKYIYKNDKFFLSLPNFRKICDKLVNCGLLTFIRKGEKPKFYGTSIFKGIKREKGEIKRKKKELVEENKDLLDEIERLKRENENLKRENSVLKGEEINKENNAHDEDRIENIELKDCIEEHKKKEEDTFIDYDKVPMEEREVMELAKKLLKGEKIKNNTPVYMSVINSLTKKVNTGYIHSQGAINYICTVIREKKINENNINRKLRNKRLCYKYKPKLRFDNFKGRDYDWDDLEKKLLGWD
ncbi:hypothetical protein [uncultured Clostridium sp.]|uniref:hypothetical protein n=1 Tax=uncultured Clostridium sp. TaxID=59620 RepID=UPI0025D523E9|nr:hypothetical protein [uncultured Clostridium sp.]